MPKTWDEATKDAIVSICFEKRNPYFSRKELIEQKIEEIKCCTSTKGRSPRQTLSRVLQDLRDEGVIDFLNNNGFYRLNGVTFHEIATEKHISPIVLDLDKTCFLLGSGFSANSGIPIQSKLKYPFFNFYVRGNSYIDKFVNLVFHKFLLETFDFNMAQPNKDFPSFEDFFTVLDLPSSTGHNLGKKIQPWLLRAIRRIAIYRLIRILDENHTKPFSYKALKKFLISITSTDKHLSFVSTNWDIVLEKELHVIKNNLFPNYFLENIPDANSSSFYDIAKVHGSSNWLYCENCKEMIKVSDQKIGHKCYSSISVDELCRLSKHYGLPFFPLFASIEIREARIAINNAYNTNVSYCSKCDAIRATHIATFSYRKSFKTHYFPRIWHEAEKILADSKIWICIGYSLPEADYEFISMLKSAQLRYGGTKKIIVVGLHPRGESETEKRYKSVFGPSITYVGNGLFAFNLLVEQGIISFR